MLGYRVVSQYVFYSIATSDVKFMLADSKSRSNGTVAMYHPSFGSRNVCDLYWRESKSSVLCRHLGYTGLKEWLVRKDVSRPGIESYDVQCSGSESTIWDCAKNEWRKLSSCLGDGVVFVSCY